MTEHLERFIIEENIYKNNLRGRDTRGFGRHLIITFNICMFLKAKASNATGSHACVRTKPVRKEKLAFLAIY